MPAGHLSPWPQTAEHQRNYEQNTTNEVVIAFLFSDKSSKCVFAIFQRDSSGWSDIKCLDILPVNSFRVHCVSKQMFASSVPQCVFTKVGVVLLALALKG